MDAIQVNSDTVAVNRSSNWAVAGKVIITALVIAALAAATFFSAGAFLGFLAAGAAGWKIVLTGIVFTVSLITTGGAVVSSVIHQMWRGTDDNKKDVKNFLVDTSLSCWRAIQPIYRFAKELIGEREPPALKVQEAQIS